MNPTAVVLLFAVAAVIKHSKITDSVPAAAVLGNSPILEEAHEVTCLGGEAVFTCTVTSNIMQFALIWREGGTFAPSVTYLYESLPVRERAFVGFTTNARVVPPNYTLLSTATLRGAQFHHNKFVIECFGTISSSSQSTVRIAGADEAPSELKISSSINTPATLTWLSPPNGSNCTFNYTVNITSSSSMTEQVYNNTYLTLTNLTHGENYSFAVAVTDSAGQYGAWSEELNITWNAPEAVVNFSARITDSTCYTSWKAPPTSLGLPVLYYTVTHNVTVSGNVEVEHTTNLSIPLSGTKPGHIYLVTVHAVNVVGNGRNTNDTCTITTSVAAVTAIKTTIMLSSTLKGLHTAASTTDFCNSNNIQLCSYCFSPMPVEEQVCGGCTVSATVAALVSGVLSAIVTSLIASCIVWCVVLRGRQKRRNTSSGVQQSVHQQETISTELVEYEVPVFNKQEIQSITTQDNVAYVGKISTQQNVAYGQVHVN